MVLACYCRERNPSCRVTYSRKKEASKENLQIPPSAKRDQEEQSTFDPVPGMRESWGGIVREESV